MTAIPPVRILRRSSRLVLACQLRVDVQDFANLFPGSAPQTALGGNPEVRGERRRCQHRDLFRAAATVAAKTSTDHCCPEVEAKEPETGQTIAVTP